MLFYNATFPLIQLLKSGENTVTLKSVSRTQSGHYQCEVSADAPLFHTETRGADLIVAELPVSEPVMTVYGMPSPDSKRIVAFGETFKTSCVSGPSYPSVNFTWIVNGIRQPVIVVYQTGKVELLKINSFTVITFRTQRYWSRTFMGIEGSMVRIDTSRGWSHCVVE